MEYPHPEQLPGIAAVDPEAGSACPAMCHRSSSSSAFPLFVDLGDLAVGPHMSKMRPDPFPDAGLRARPEFPASA